MEKKINLADLTKLIFQPGIPEEIRDTFFTLADARTGSRFAYKLHCTMKEELGPIELELAQLLIAQANKASDFYVQFWDSLYNYRPALALANMPEANDDPGVEAQAFQDFVNQYFSKEARAFVAGYLSSKPTSDGKV